MHPMNVYAISQSHSSYLMLSMFDNNVFWVELDSWKNNNSMLFGQFLISAFFLRCLLDQNKNGFFFHSILLDEFFFFFFFVGHLCHIMVACLVKLVSLELWFSQFGRMKIVLDTAITVVSVLCRILFHSQNAKQSTNQPAKRTNERTNNSTDKHEIVFHYDFFFFFSFIFVYEQNQRTKNQME